MFRISRAHNSGDIMVRKTFLMRKPGVVNRNKKEVFIYSKENPSNNLGEYIGKLNEGRS